MNPSIGLRLLQAVAETAPVKRLFKRAHIDVKCGACSGLPVCCVTFMSFVWSPAFMRWGTRMVAGKLLQKPKATMPFLLRWYPQWRHKRWGYVPCPLCLLRKHRVEVHVCEAGCACGLGDWRAQRRKKKVCPSPQATR